MDTTLLKKLISEFISDSKKDPITYNKELTERLQLTEYYKSFTDNRILAMTEEDIYRYISQLWAMQIWGNKHYVVDKIIGDNGLQNFTKSLADLIWGSQDISERWDSFRKEVKGMGPAMISEILCKTHPNDYMLWNRRAYVGLRYLKVENLPRYDYQHTGKVYWHLCNVCKEIAKELGNAGFQDCTLLAVDYFIWNKLQIEETLSKIYDKKDSKVEKIELQTRQESTFIHDEIRDKLRDIGQWLGFQAAIERKVSEGSIVDTVWESTIGNMGRVIYVFEVQTKGSIDSLMLNLIKSLNNSAVQGVVAVSDSEQLEKIKKHALDVQNLRDKLKYWDYKEILRVHESLEYVNECINNLQLVPRGF